MYVFGKEAFTPDLTPSSLYRVGLDIGQDDNELGEALVEFAGDLATILNLPQTRQPVRS